MEIVDYTIPKTARETLPDYWETYIKQRIKRLNELDEWVGEDGDVIAFITDVHWPGNAKYSPLLLDRIRNETRLDKVIFGGDILNNHTKADGTVILKDGLNAFIKYFGNNFYYANGNHDNNPYMKEPFTYAEQYDLCMKYLEGHVVQQEQGENGFHYYFDIEDKKIRYIILDTKNMQPVYQKQLKWFAETALSLPDGWSVAVFMHWGYNIRVENNSNGSRTEFLTLVEDILAAVREKKPYVNEELDINVSYANDISVMFIASGHSHVDSEVDNHGNIHPDDHGLISFTTDRDGCLYGGWNVRSRKVWQTCMEQCFDIIHINRAARRVYISRIGYGADRVFAY